MKDNPLQHELDLITLMPDAQTQELLNYIAALRAVAPKETHGDRLKRCPP